MHEEPVQKYPLGQQYRFPQGVDEAGQVKPEKKGIFTLLFLFRKNKNKQNKVRNNYKKIHRIKTNDKTSMLIKIATLMPIVIKYRKKDKCQSLDISMLHSVRKNITTLYTSRQQIFFFTGVHLSFYYSYDYSYGFLKSHS